MFGWLNSNKLNEDAILLKTTIDVMVKEYTDLSWSDAKLAIKQEFKNAANIDNNSCRFEFYPLPDFIFGLDSQSESEGLTVFAEGRGAYSGFLLTVAGNSWAVSLVDEIFPATRKAKKLAELLEHKYQIRNIAKQLQRMGLRR